jgi:excisionase family DNA binding protein
MPNGRITVMEISKRLGIGKMAVYGMLEKGVLPGLRVGRRWIITRQAYEQWERTCGTKAAAVTVSHRELLT